MQHPRYHGAEKVGAAAPLENGLFEAQVHSAVDGILVVDSENKKILQNQRMVELWEIPRELAEGLDDRVQLEWVANQTKDPRQFREKVAYLTAHPDEISREEVDLTNGKCFDRYTAPVRGQDGKYYGRIWHFRDITERKKVEARFRRLVDSNVQGVIFWNRKGEITEANEAFLNLVRYSRADLEEGRLNWGGDDPAGICGPG